MRTVSFGRRQENTLQRVLRVDDLALTKKVEQNERLIAKRKASKSISSKQTPKKMRDSVENKSNKKKPIKSNYFHKRHASTEVDSDNKILTPTAAMQEYLEDRRVSHAIQQ